MFYYLDQLTDHFSKVFYNETKTLWKKILKNYIYVYKYIDIKQKESLYFISYTTLIKFKNPSRPSLHPRLNNAYISQTIIYTIMTNCLLMVIRLLLI